MIDAMNTLKALRARNLLGYIDLQLADFVQRATGASDFGLLAAVALASRTVNEGHACIDLKEYASKPFPCPPEKTVEGDTDASETDPGALPVLPELSAWQATLKTDAARKMVGHADENRPFVLDDTRLYLRRYWAYEDHVAKKFRELASADAAGKELTEGLKKRIAEYFPDDKASAGAANLQRDAASKAFRRRLSILCGGPGTGKTHTLARIVALLAEFHPKDTPLRVRIAAPTGKASARVVESLREAKRGLKVIATEEVLAKVPEEASTLHRLLGTIPGSPYFRHNRENPLDADLVIVDESSMVDLPLMAKLLDALPPTCRLMLVGDRFQLASVEPGRVYGDLCEAAARSETLRACMTELTYSHRFDKIKAIGTLATAVNAGNKEAWQVLEDVCGPEVARHDVAGNSQKGRTGLDQKAFRDTVVTGYKAFLEATDAETALKAAKQFRVLCALRRGPYGVQMVNRLIEEVLASAGEGTRRLSPSGMFYDHRLIMVTVNDYSLNLYNGDVGVVFKEKGGAGTDRMVAYFEGETTDGKPRAVPVNLLPEHETAFAMTVHKSQGSEFDTVALVLPPDAESPILTRELLYTGVTRVKMGLKLWCTEASFTAAVARKTQRPSGLGARLAPG